MGIIKNDLEFVQLYGEGLKYKIYDMGTGEIEECIDSNIAGVSENLDAFNECVNLVKEYKEQLEDDLEKIKQIGITFFDIDHNMIKF